MTIRLWDLSTGIESVHLPAHQSSITSIAFSANGKTLVAGNAESQIHFWDLATESLQTTLLGHQGRVRCVAFSADGKVLASGGQDRTIRIWSLDSFSEIKQFKGHKDGVSGLAFSPDGQMLASSSADETARLWDTTLGHEIVQLDHDGSVEGVAFSPNSAMVATACWDKSISVWDAHTGTRLYKFTGHHGGVKSVAFAPNSRWLASGSGDSTVRVWELPTQRELRVLRGHQGVVLSVVFSVDGKTLASGSSDSLVRIWSMATGTVTKRFQGHQGLVSALAFSPDGKSLASASTGGTFEGRDAPSSVLTEPVAAPAAGDPAVDLEKAWLLLADPGPRSALRASRDFLSVPQQAERFLTTRLRPIPPPDRSAFPRILQALTASDQGQREKAAADLLRYGELAEPIIREMLQENSAADLRVRLEQVLLRLRSATPSPEIMRELRVVELLVRLGSSGARQLLQELARGVPEALLTEAARSALERPCWG